MPVVFILILTSCRLYRPAREEEENEEDGEMRVCSTKVKNMDTLCLGFLYFDNSLRSIKRCFGYFFKLKRSFKDGFWRAFY